MILSRSSIIGCLRNPLWQGLAGLAENLDSVRHTCKDGSFFGRSFPACLPRSQRLLDRSLAIASLSLLLAAGMAISRRLKDVVSLADLLPQI